VFGLLPAGDGGKMRDMGSTDDFNDTQSRRSLHQTKTISSQREKSTSTMVKDKKDEDHPGGKKVIGTVNRETPSI
jgi:hypothetical protein